MNTSKPFNVAHHPFFRGMDPEHLEIVAGSAKQLTCKPGQFLFHEGEPANRFFLIESGQIALEAHQPADGTVLIQHIGEGDVLGWSWLYPPFVWHFRARVVEPTKIIVLDGARLLCIAEHNREFGYELMKRVSQIVIRRLQTTRKQLFSPPQLIPAA